ncbi:MAG: hypothetical protein WDZ28_03775 [Simkaniaceae bacterium]
MKKLASLILFGCSVIATNPVQADLTLETSTYEEAFLVRRIAEFFKDGDYDIVKQQIQDFFVRYPNSPLKEHLHGVLGDLYLEEASYDQALENYAKIEDHDVAMKIFLNKLQCYYELSSYENITDEGTSLHARDIEKFGDRKDEFNFLMAESLYRQALDATEQCNKESLASMAMNFYEKLSNSSYADVSHFALAEIYSILKMDEKAVETFLKLASSHPNMKEELLFKAASNLAMYDKKQAIAEYARIIDLDGNFSKEASFNQLILFYQTGEYEKVIQAFPRIERTIPESQLPTFQYILAKSYFSIKDFEKAIEPISAFISTANSKNPHYKNALLISMACAYEMKNSSLFGENLSLFKTHFNHDGELPKALFMHAMLSKESGSSKEVLHELEELMSKHKDFNQRESLLFEYAFITHQNGLYQKSRKSAKEYLDEFTGSSREGAAWKLYLSSSLEVYKAEENLDEKSYGKEQFFADLAQVLEKKDLLKDEEKSEYQLLYAKMAYELGFYPKAFDALTEYVDSSFASELTEAHFLMGLCLHHLENDVHLMVGHFEKVIELDPEFKQKALVHLHLFNGYLQVREGIKNETLKEDYTSKAANHLYTSMQLSDHPIKLENRLWLADHYYKKAKFLMNNDLILSNADLEKMQNFTKRGSELYKNVLYPNNRKKLIQLTKETLYLESEALKYCELLDTDKKYNEKIALLKDLVEMQDAHPDLSWTFTRTALFELANAYERNKDFEKALDTYSFISNRERNISSPIVNVATFHSAKLRFLLLEEGQKSESNEEIHEILTQLKELQIRKTAESEPVHLEAAIEYARVRAFLAKAEEKDARYLFFLNRMVEDFSASDDLLNKHYKESLAKAPEKQELFNNYMSYIQAERLRIKAKNKRAENALLEAEELNEQALSILFELEENETLKEYLHKRILKSIDEISEQETF